MELPLDCKAWHYPDFLTHTESKALYRSISQTCDLSDVVVQMADESVVTLSVGKFVFADPERVESPLAEPWGVRHHWTPEIREAKEKVEAIAKRKYDVCIGYYYKDGTIGFEPHYDLPTFDDPSTLACLSLGQDRVFRFRRHDNHDEIYDLPVPDGSLTVMGEHCRERYEHGLNVDPAAKDPRMVLVFMDFSFRSNI